MDLIGGGPAAGFLLTVVFFCGVGLYAIVPVIAAWMQLPRRDCFNSTLIEVVWPPMAVHVGVLCVAVYLMRSDGWRPEHTVKLVLVGCAAAIACTVWSHYRAKARGS